MILQKKNNKNTRAYRSHWSVAVESLITGTTPPLSPSIQAPSSSTTSTSSSAVIVNISVTGSTGFTGRSPVCFFKERERGGGGGVGCRPSEKTSGSRRLLPSRFHRLRRQEGERRAG
ncbi:hypothetical protein HanIR_Chr05g0221541 [Helianthus annuus]|nr:hypothetical protein HanIR_Chr05g0221541 [Helianthus annuus]